MDSEKERVEGKEKEIKMEWKCRKKKRNSTTKKRKFRHVTIKQKRESSLKG